MRRAADDHGPSRALVRDIGSKWSAAPGGARRIGYREWARRSGRLSDIHSIEDRYDHDIDELMA